MKTLKKLIVLVGDPELKQKVSTLLIKDNLALPLSAMAEVVEQLSILFDIPDETFTDPELAQQEFPKSLVVTSPILARYSSRLSLGTLSVAHAGRRVKNANDILKYMVDELGEKKFGSDWVAKRFANDYAYRPKAIYLVSDIDSSLPYLREQISRKELVVIELRSTGEVDATNSKYFDSDLSENVDLVLKHGRDQKGLTATTRKLLQAVNEKFMK